MIHRRFFIKFQQYARTCKFALNRRREHNGVFHSGQLNFEKNRALNLHFTGYHLVSMTPDDVHICTLRKLKVLNVLIFF